MLTTDDDELAAKLRLLRSHGMTSLTLDRHEGRAYSYDVVELGFNYRERTGLYHQLLKKLCPSVCVPFQTHPGLSAAHLLAILLPEGIRREAFMARMKSRGIQTSVHFPPVHQFSAYRELYPGASAGLERTETLGAREVTLPLYPTLTKAEVRLVVGAVRDSLADLE